MGQILSRGPYVGVKYCLEGHTEDWVKSQVRLGRAVGHNVEQDKIRRSYWKQGPNLVQWPYNSQPPQPDSITVLKAEEKAEMQRSPTVQLKN
jgi:hypothetical protein